jgi:creatinine amidohydrolase
MTQVPYLVGSLAIVMTMTTPLTQAAGALLGELTWPEAERRLAAAPVVVLPFGAGAKEHGPHLPMNTDQRIMEYLVAAAVAEADVVVAPPILHGWFPAFRQYPGTEVAEPDVFRAYVAGVAESLVRSGAQRLVFLNTGIREATGLPIAIVAREIRARHGVPTLVVSWDDLETEAVSDLQRQAVSGHADEVETSIMLALAPEQVRMDLTRRDDGPFAPKDYPGYRPGVFARDRDDPLFSETGQRGDPTQATAELGRRALEIMRDNWLRALDGFSSEPTSARSGTDSAP